MSERMNERANERMNEELLDEEAREVLSVRDYLLVIQRHRVLIAAIALAVTVVTVLFSATRTPIYESRSELLVSPFQLAADPQLTPAAGSSGAGSLATELRLIVSAPVRDRVAAQLGLAPSDPRLLGVSVSQISGTSIVTIVATDSDPVIAASVSNAYATAYLDSRRDRVLARVVSARRAIDQEITDLQAQLADVDQRILERQSGRDDAVVAAREQLRTLERDLEELLRDRDERAEDPASRLASVQGRIVALDTQVRSLELQLRDIDADLTVLAGGSGLVDARLAISDRRTSLTSQRDALGTRSSIQARIAANSPAIEGESATRRNARRDAEDALREWDRLDAQIAGLSDDIIRAADLQLERDRLLIELSRVTNQRNQLARDPANLTPTAVADLAAFDVDIAELEQVIADQQADIDRALSTPTVDVSSLTLERDVLFSRLSAFIGQRATLVEDSSGLTDGGEVLVRGTVPVSPVSPRPALAGLLALLVGLLLGIGLALTRDHLEDAIRDDLDVRRATGGRPLLGRIPEWVIPGPSRDGIVTLLDPSSVAAESYRELSANVRFMALSGRGPDGTGAGGEGLGADAPDTFDLLDAAQRPAAGRSIMMVSATANNGKTATAVNLAVSSARAGQRVVIVDADLRRPRVATLFGLGRLRGLSDLLAERGSVDDHLVNVGVPNLLVLPAGTLPPNPADVLAASQLDVVHRQLKERFDLIIYDTPAVLAVPDALEVGRLVDWGLLVMQHTVSTRREVAGTIQRLEQVGVPIEGGVLNAIDTRSDAYYYYYTYYHRLEYGAVPGDDPAENATLRTSRPRVPVGPGGPGGAGSGAGPAPRDRVLVPAAPPRGGMLRRLGLLGSEDDAVSSTRDRRGGVGASGSGASSRFGGLLGRDEDVTGEFDDDEPRDA